MSKTKDLMTPQERQKYENLGRVEKAKFTKALKPVLEKRAREALGLSENTPVKVEGGRVVAVQEVAPPTPAPTPSPVGFGEMVQSDHRRFLELSRKYNIDPLEGLFQALADPEVSLKDKIAIQKFLVPYQVVKKPELKAIDVQQDLKMNVRVEMTSFARTRPEDLPSSTQELYPVEVYDEFMDNEFMDVDEEQVEPEPGT